MEGGSGVLQLDKCVHVTLCCRHRNTVSYNVCYSTVEAFQAHSVGMDVGSMTSVAWLCTLHFSTAGTLLNQFHDYSSQCLVGLVEHGGCR